MPKWKVLNEIREISGKICMKAFTYDSIRKQNVVAWFTGDIAVNTGPERYFGLPGAILELDIDDGAVVVTALKIEMKPVNELLKFNKKVKGKKISGNDYNLLVTSILRDAMKAHRYPYWSMQFKKKNVTIKKERLSLSIFLFLYLCVLKIVRKRNSSNEFDF